MTNETKHNLAFAGLLLTILVVAGFTVRDCFAAHQRRVERHAAEDRKHEHSNEYRELHHRRDADRRESPGNQVRQCDLERRRRTDPAERVSRLRSQQKRNKEYHEDKHNVLDVVCPFREGELSAGDLVEDVLKEPERAHPAAQQPPEQHAEQQYGTDG